MSISSAIPEQRSGADRREFSWRTVAYGFALSRRHAHRKRLGRKLGSTLIELGMIEANPVMNAAMAQGTVLFTSTKLAMTGVGILVLVFLAKSRFLNRIRTGLFLTIFFSFYACLVCYELVNLFRLL